MELRLFRSAKMLVSSAAAFPCAMRTSQELRQHPSWRDEQVSRVRDWAVEWAQPSTTIGWLHLRDQDGQVWSEVVTLGTAVAVTGIPSLPTSPGFIASDDGGAMAEHLRLGQQNCCGSSLLSRLIWSTAASGYGARILGAVSQLGRDRSPRPSRNRQEDALHQLLQVPNSIRLGAMRIHPVDPIGFGIINAVEPPCEFLPRQADLQRLHLALQAVVAGAADVEQCGLALKSATSLGGRRPKATFMDSRGLLAVVKFSASGDRVDHCALEALTLRVAALCGLQPQKPALLPPSVWSQRRILVSGRLDRDDRGLPIGWLPARVLVPQRPDVDSSSWLRRDVIELLNWMRAGCADFAADAKVLFRRLLFMGLLGQGGDPLRKVAFLQSPAGRWRLAPVVGLRIPDEASGLSGLAEQIEEAVALAPLCGFNEVQVVGLLREQMMRWVGWRVEAAAIGWSPAADDITALIAAVHRIQKVGDRAIRCLQRPGALAALCPDEGGFEPKRHA